MLFDVLTQIGKHGFGTTNSFSAADKYKFGGENSLPQSEKGKSCAANLFPAPQRTLSGASDILPGGGRRPARAASDETCKALVQHVNAHALIEGEVVCSAFIDYANTELARFKQEVPKVK